MTTKPSQHTGHFGLDEENLYREWSRDLRQRLNYSRWASSSSPLGPAASADAVTGDPWWAIIRHRPSAFRAYRLSAATVVAPSTSRMFSSSETHAASPRTSTCSLVRMNC